MHVDFSLPSLFARFEDEGKSAGVFSRPIQRRLLELR